MCCNERQDVALSVFSKRGKLRSGCGDVYVVQMTGKELSKTSSSGFCLSAGDYGQEVTEMRFTLKKI